MTTEFQKRLNKISDRPSINVPAGLFTCLTPKQAIVMAFLISCANERRSFSFQLENDVLLNLLDLTSSQQSQVFRDLKNLGLITCKRTEYQGKRTITVCLDKVEELLS